MLVIKRSSHPAPEPGESSGQRDGLGAGSAARPIGPEEEVMTAPEPRRTDSDIEDEGGDAGYAAAKDKARLKVYRSFEIVLTNGRIIRFEVNCTLSCGDGNKSLISLV